MTDGSEVAMSFQLHENKLIYLYTAVNSGRLRH